VAKPEWGRRRICQSCSTPFYDMQKATIACPKCGTEFNPEQILKARRSGSAEETRARSKPVAKPLADFRDDDVLIEDDEILIAEPEEDADFIPDEDAEIGEEEVEADGEKEE
jgi:uncharacterized protein (TIGR02300 family)